MVVLGPRVDDRLVLEDKPVLDGYSLCVEDDPARVDED